MNARAELLPVPPIVRLLRPLHGFLENKAIGGVLLLLCAAVALAWANSPWAASYEALWRTPFTVGPGAAALSKPLLLWVNDALMAVFFFVVGLEIKREILVGELSSPRQAALPIAAAVGGIVVPAMLYILVNAGGPGAAGWGIPMATDIAFALGILALLGSRVPLALTVFLTALAIVDDIAAVLVIALFYTAQISWGALAVAALCLVSLAAMNRLGIRWPLAYAAAGVVLWIAVLKSGIHATVAGVLLAFFIPARTRIDPERFVREGRELLNHFERSGREGAQLLTNEEQLAALHALEEASEDVQPPLHRLEHNLHPWVGFLVMPLFALANAGVAMRGEASPDVASPVTLGVILGLLIGKPVGILLASWLAVRAGMADLPARVSWAGIHGAAWLGGIGFTMSLFIGGLAFSDASLLASAKVGILAASSVAGITGYLLLRRTLAGLERGR
ncbi:MAG: Na+/H+ antiporter NhaA [Bryobacteraceae bacterium]|nr:Na+/H+ antiporter NhaA [Bryobacteraceae bacterium]